MAAVFVDISNATKLKCGACFSPVCDWRYQSPAIGDINLLRLEIVRESPQTKERL